MIQIHSSVIFFDIIIFILKKCKVLIYKKLSTIGQPVAKLGSKHNKLNVVTVSSSIGMILSTRTSSS